MNERDWAQQLVDTITAGYRKEAPAADVWREDLMTSVSSLHYNFAEHAGILLMPSNCCTDMRGAIALFEAIDADVSIIRTISGEIPETVYIRRGGEWHAREPSQRAQALT